MKDEDLLVELEKQVKILEKNYDILKRSKEIGKSFFETELAKKIEDGMIKNISNAKMYQLEKLSEGFYRTSYYEQDYFKKIVDIEILRKKREQKLNRINA